MSSQSALAEKVRLSNGTITTRQAAQDSFIANKANQAKYTTTFASEPATRPSYIPQGYVDPVYRSYRYVYYNPSYMGYGYWDAYGHWVFYDALRAASVREATLLPTASYPYPWFSIMMWTVGIVIFIGALFWFISRFEDRRYSGY